MIGEIKRTPTVTAWALAKLVKNKYAVDLSDRSINNIFVKNNITRKKVSSLTAKHPHRLSARQREKLDGLVGLGAGGAYFVGYFSIFLNTPKKYGRSFRGERALKMSASASVPSLHLYFMYIIHGGKILEWKCVAGGGGGVGDLLFEFFKDKYAEKYRKGGAGGAAAVILFNENRKISSAYSYVVVDKTKYLTKAEVEGSRCCDIILKLKKQILKSSPENENELTKVLKDAL